MKSESGFSLAISSQPFDSPNIYAKRLSFYFVHLWKEEVYNIDVVSRPTRNIA